MDIWFDTAAALEDAISAVAQELPEFDATFTPLVRPADPRFGDLQANGVLPYAKAQKANPRELGLKLLAGIQEAKILDSELIHCDIAGPGFINFTLTPAFRLQWLKTYRDEEAFKQAASHLYSGKKVVVDFSSPNTAKQMHVGHIRSTVIGDSLCRLLAFCGASVTRDNHIGDWGTQFGLLILGIQESGFDLETNQTDPIASLERIYKETQARAKDDEAVMQAARAELVKLQQGDAENTALWEKINTISYQMFEQAYSRLRVHFDEVLGESFYRDKVERIYTELTDTQLAEESDGALVVFHPEHPRFNEQPFIIRKSDGASNYATTDLATVLYRIEHFDADAIVYLTDDRQKDHFEQLFLTVEKWFKAKQYRHPKLHHVTFGKILGEDGKAIKTRSGDPVKLGDLLNEAVERAYQIVTKKNTKLSEEERKHIAEVVGVSALRYADLMQNRSTNYAFSWDKMLSFDGNTAPYLLYAVARIHSIFRKIDGDIDVIEEEASCFETPVEQSLARQIMGFPHALQQALDDMRPHYLCTYLYELAGEFSSFYNADKVIGVEKPVQARRLLLCARTLRVLETGLRLLGIEPLSRM